MSETKQEQEREQWYVRIEERLNLQSVKCRKSLGDLPQQAQASDERGLSETEVTVRKGEK